MFESLITRICYAILWATLSVIFVILCAKTILRYATGSDIDWGNEVPELLFPWLVMSGVVLAALRGSHITTTFLKDRFSPVNQRYLAIGVWVLVALLYAFLIVATGKMLPLVHAEKSPILGIPNSVTFGCVLLGMVGLFLIALRDLVRAVKTPPEQLAKPAVPNTHF
jgi:TRAP-type transport system small permease protein